MQRYMQDLRKQKPSDTVTMKKYIKAHSTHHDDYQQSEETKSENIAKQNNETLRLHPELIPFEISDAKVPDSETLKLIEQNKEERKNDSTSKDRKVLVKKDMSTAESIMVKITHPGPVTAGNRQRSLQDLPLEVQNAINFFVQKENSQKLTSPKYPNSNQYKAPSRLSKNWWRPVHINSHSVATPLVLHPQFLNNFTPTKLYSKPSPIYQKFETPDRTLHTKLPELQAAKPVKPVDVLYTFKTEYPVYSAPKTLSEQKYASPSLPEKLLTNGDQNLVDLTSLVGLEPDQQLQGLSEILGKQGKYWDTGKPVRPQDSTAPVLFPLGARLPKPRPATDKPLFVVNAVSYSTTSAPEVTTKAFTYNDIKHSYKNNHLLSSSYFNTKDHIPISENTPDILPNHIPSNKNAVSVVSSRPIFVAPILEKGKAPTSFQRHYGRSADVRKILFYLY